MFTFPYFRVFQESLKAWPRAGICSPEHKCEGKEKTSALRKERQSGKWKEGKSYIKYGDWVLEREMSPVYFHIWILVFSSEFLKFYYLNLYLIFHTVYIDHIPLTPILCIVTLPKFLSQTYALESFNTFPYSFQKDFCVSCPFYITSFTFSTPPSLFNLPVLVSSSSLYSFLKYLLHVYFDGFFF